MVAHGVEPQLGLPSKKEGSTGSVLSGEFNIPGDLPFPSSPTVRNRTYPGSPGSAYPTPLGGGGATPKLREEGEVPVSDSSILNLYSRSDDLGKGGFGTVWKACDKKTGKCFAIKTIPIADITSKERFEMELGIHKKLSHPNICTLHEATQDETHYHLRMDYLDNGSLADCILFQRKMYRKVVGMQLTDCVGFFWQMLSGITYLHHYGMAHRDIKPSNYMVMNGGRICKLIDFGLSRRFTKGEKMTSHGIGSTHFMAPEVLAKDGNGYDERCDLWSIGATVFTIVQGEPPFTGSGHEELAKQIASDEIDWEKPGFPVWQQATAIGIQKVLMNLLTRDLTKRPRAKTVVRESEWLRQNGAKGGGACCSLQ